MLVLKYYDHLLSINTQNTHTNSTNCPRKDMCACLYESCASFCWLGSALAVCNGHRQSRTKSRQPYICEPEEELQHVEESLMLLLLQLLLLLMLLLSLASWTDCVVSSQNKCIDLQRKQLAQQMEHKNWTKNNNHGQLLRQEQAAEEEEETATEEEAVTEAEEKAEEGGEKLTSCQRSKSAYNVEESMSGETEG